MKMVKSLFLGTAAGLVAMSGAQAADLPVKAKPVQYVKICSLYGAGFFYIPGTDTCLKIGGYVRLQEQTNVNANSSNGPLGGGTNVNNRSTMDFTSRNRGYITADAREQTEYGTLRSYIAVGVSGDNPQGAQSTTLSANRAFIQLGGFTAGRAQSFFDFTNSPAYAYFAGAGSNWGGGQTTGDAGWNVLAYTAQLGNGLSASLSVEDNRSNTVNFYAAPAFPSAAFAGTSSAIGNKMPDLVANLNITQAWGAAQIGAALHDASGTYYGATPGTGHPGNTFGYALSAGVKVNFPMLGKGDWIDMMYIYSAGASKYASAGLSYGMVSGATSGYGLNTDSVYGPGGSIQLTEVQTVFGGYQHNWNDKWKTSLYGSYGVVNYNGTATGVICSAAAQAAGCNPDWKTYDIGSRTEWAPVANLTIGVDVMYTSLKAANTGVVATSQDQNAWFGQFRVQRNFYP